MLTFWILLFFLIKSFEINGAVNLHNCRYWSDENPYWMSDFHTQYLQKLNVWAGICSCDIMSPFFMHIMVIWLLKGIKIYCETISYLILKIYLMPICKMFRSSKILAEQTRTLLRNKNSKIFESIFSWSIDK